MPRSRTNRTLASAGMLLLAMSLTTVMAQSSQSARTASERPNGTRPASASVPAESVQLFKNKDFDGTMNQVSDVTNKPSWSAQSVAGKSKDEVSSVRWNLPRGVVVTLFENTGGLGRQVNLWGTGEIVNLNAWKVNDKITSWSWNYVGGTPDPSERLKGGRSPRPKYAKEDDSVAGDSLKLYKDHEGKGKSASIERLTSEPQGVFHKMPEEIGKHASSVKWKLPEGVVVVLSEHSNGEGPQVAFWGNGRFDEFTLWDMNDKAAYWAWYDAGASH